VSVHPAGPRQTRGQSRETRSLSLEASDAVVRYTEKIGEQPNWRKAVGRTERKYVRESFHERQLIVQNEHITLWYYPELKIIHHQMMEPPTSQEFRELLQKGAETLERFRATKWMSDDRGNTLLKPDDEAWAQKEWLPRVLRAGFKFWAIVLPAAAIGKLNMQRLANDHLRYGISTRIEAMPGPAFEWLKAQ
jgi:hypothetical protein